MKRRPEARRGTAENLRDLSWDGFTLPLGERTLIMGVLNRTPDSFSDGGMFMDDGLAVEHARRMESEGADIIDVGGESTRPGAEPVSAEEELARTAPLIKELAGKLNIPISIEKTLIGSSRISCSSSSRFLCLELVVTGT